MLIEKKQKIIKPNLIEHNQKSYELLIKNLKKSKLLDRIKNKDICYFKRIFLNKVVRGLDK